MCERHRKTNQRHGHPEQQGVLLGELTGYKKTLVKFIDSRKDADQVWAVIERHWQAFNDWVEGEIQYHSKRAYQKHYMAALRSIQSVGRDREPRDVMITVIAYIWLWHDRPQRFMSDRAAWFQAARVLRRMTDAHVGQVGDALTGRIKRYYRDVPPRVLNDLGRLIFDGLGRICMNVIRAYERDQEDKKEQVKEAHKVISRGTQSAGQRGQGDTLSSPHPSQLDRSECHAPS